MFSYYLLHAVGVGILVLGLLSFLYDFDPQKGLQVRDRLPAGAFTWIYAFAADLALLLIAMILYIRLKYGDPGFVPFGEGAEEAEAAEEGRKCCASCSCCLGLRIRHCNFCGRCIDRFGTQRNRRSSESYSIFQLDHHCPFIGRCVGRSNHRMFYFYLTFECAFLLLSAILVRYPVASRYVLIHGYRLY